MKEYAKSLIPGAIIGIAAFVTSFSTYHFLHEDSCTSQAQLTHFVDYKGHDLYIDPRHVIKIAAGDDTDALAVLYTSDGDARVTNLSPANARKALDATTVSGK